MGQSNVKPDVKSNPEAKSFSNPKSRSELYGRGWRFIEHQAGEKKPAEKGWQKKSPKTVDEVAGFKDCGVFLSSCAAPTALVCVDIDNLELPPVKDAVNSLVEKGVMHSRTPSGGYHFYFARCNMADQMLAGKKRRSIKIGQNKVGDLLGFHTTFYEPTNCQAEIGNFKSEQKVLDLVRGVAHIDLAAGADNARRAFMDDIANLKGQDGSRNVGFFAAVCKLVNPVFLYEMDREYLVKHILTPGLAKYKEINPEDTSFTAEQCLNTISDYQPSKESRKILGACSDKKGLGEYIYQRLVENCDGKIYVAEGGKVYHWQKHPTPCWVERNLTSGIGNVISLAALIMDEYEYLFRLLHDKTAPLEKSNKIVEEVLRKVKTQHSNATIEQKFAASEVGLMLLSDGLVSKFGVKEFTPDVGNKPDYYLTHKLGVISNEPPVRFLKFLEELFPEDTEQNIRMLSELVAAPFVEGVQPLFIMCHGGGSNGKSVLLSTLKYALGDYAETVSEKLVVRVQDNKRQLATRKKLVGKHVGIITESSASRVDEDFIKSLLTGDSVEVGGLHMNSTEVKLRVSLWMACNECPKFRTTSRGITRRMIRLPFNATFVGDLVDPMLAEKLKLESDQIRGWIYQACKRLAEKGGVIDFTESSQQSTDDLIEENTPPLKEALSRWMEPCTEDEAKARGIFTGQYRTNADKGCAIGPKPSKFPTGLLIAARLCETQNNGKEITGPKYVNAVMESLNFKRIEDAQTKTKIWLCKETEEFRRLLEDECGPNAIDFLFCKQVAQNPSLRIVPEDDTEEKQQDSDWSFS